MVQVRGAWQGKDQGERLVFAGTGADVGWGSKHAGRDAAALEQAVVVWNTSWQAQAGVIDVVVELQGGQGFWDQVFEPWELQEWVRGRG